MKHVIRAKPQSYFDGQEAARKLLPIDALESAGFGSFDVASRLQWISGWESEGGDITRRIVVTKEMWMRERKIELERELDLINRELGSASDFDFPIDRDWLDSSNLSGYMPLGGSMRLGIFGSFGVSLASEMNENIEETEFPNIKTRRQLLTLIGLLNPEHPMGIKV